MRDKGQRFLQRKTADAENPVYENANVSRETLEFIQSCLWGWLCWWIVNSWLAGSRHEGVRLGIECYFLVFNKFLSCHWNGFTWNMVGLVGSQVGCLRVLFLLYELPGIRVGLFIACFTWNNRNYKITKGKLKIAVWETYLSISNYSHDQCFTWNLEAYSAVPNMTSLCK